jgi:hypothetical protein
MTLIKLIRFVKITVSSFPASVLPKAAHRFSAYGCFGSSKIINGSLKKICSHSQFSTLCPMRELTGGFSGIMGAVAADYIGGWAGLK